MSSQFYIDIFQFPELEGNHFDSSLFLTLTKKNESNNTFLKLGILEKASVCFLMVLILFMIPAFLSAQTSDANVLVFRFPSCAKEYRSAYADNSKTVHRLDSLMNHFQSGKQTLFIDAYSGDCREVLTAHYRCHNIKCMFVNRYKLKEHDFCMVKHMYPHPELGEVVKIAFAPRTSAFVNESPEEVANRDTVLINTHFVSTFRDTMFVTPCIPSLVKQEERLSRYIALKTNFVGWGMILANFAAEVEVAKHFSVELPLYYSGWDVNNKHALRTFLLQPEARYWLSGTGRGHFFGLHAHVGIFNLKWDRDRYQDTERPLLGAGISYGYLLPFARHWGAEFTLGAGYASMKYNTYYNIANGACIDTSTKHYFGITRIGISLVYHFNGTNR